MTPCATTPQIYFFSLFVMFCWVAKPSFACKHANGVNFRHLKRVAKLFLNSLDSFGYIAIKVSSLIIHSPTLPLSHHGQAVQGLRASQVRFLCQF